MSNVQGTVPTHSSSNTTANPSAPVPKAESPTAKPEFTVNDEPNQSFDGTSNTALESPNKKPAPKAPAKPAMAKPEGEEEGTEDPTEKKATAAGKRRAVVDGKEIEVEEKDVDKLIQLGLAGHKRMQEAAAKEKALLKRIEEASNLEARAQKILEKLEKNPLEALMEVHKDDEKVRGFLEPYLAERIRQDIEDEKNPLAKELRMERQRREQAEGKLKSEEETKAAQLREAATKHHREHFEKRIMGMLEKYDIPKNERSVSQAADWMLRAQRNKIEYSDEDIATAIRNDNIETIQGLTGSLLEQAKKARADGDHATLVKLGDQVISQFGQELVDLIRFSDLARIQSKQPTVPAPVVETAKTTQKPQPGKNQYMDWDEWQEKRRERAERASRGEEIGDW